jgi:hypothetical protein
LLANLSDFIKNIYAIGYIYHFFFKLDGARQALPRCCMIRKPIAIPASKAAARKFFTTPGSCHRSLFVSLTASPVPIYLQTTQTLEFGVNNLIFFVHLKEKVLQIKYNAAMERGNCFKYDELTSQTPHLFIFRDPVASSFCFGLDP